MQRCGTSPIQCTLGIVDLHVCHRPGKNNSTTVLLVVQSGLSLAENNDSTETAIGQP